MDIACSTRNVPLLRRLEQCAPYVGWLLMKVGLSPAAGFACFCWFGQARCASHTLMPCPGKPSCCFWFGLLLCLPLLHKSACPT